MLRFSTLTQPQGRFESLSFLLFEHRLPPSLSISSFCNKKKKVACSLCDFFYSHYVAHRTIKKHYVLEVEAVQVMMQNNNKKNKLLAAFSCSETAALCTILRFMQQQGEKGALSLSSSLPLPFKLRGVKECAVRSNNVQNTAVAASIARPQGRPSLTFNFFSHPG